MVWNNDMIILRAPYQNGYGWAFNRYRLKSAMSTELSLCQTMLYLKGKPVIEKACATLICTSAQTKNNHVKIYMCTKRKILK